MKEHKSVQQSASASPCNGAISAGIDRSDLAHAGPGRPRMRVAISILRSIMNTVGAAPPESGGILGGPKDSDDITEFVRDEGGTWTGTRYTPDHEGLNRTLRDDWKPHGLDFKGFVHSHPDGYTQLSPGDLRYIRDIFACNPGMRVFMAPIVLPALFWIRPFIVWRGKRLVVEEAVLEVFDPETTGDQKGALA